MNAFANLTWGTMLATIGSLLWLVVKALLVLGVGMLLTKWLLRFSKSCLGRSKINVTLHTFILSCVKIVCYIFLIVIALSMLGIPTTSLVTAIGTAGVAIGLALKDSLSNFASGVLILANAPFKVGDYVDIGGQSGVVMEIGLMTTKLKTLDNRHIVLPNNNVTTGTVTNYSAEDTRRLDMNFTIGYRDDAEKAIALINGIIASKGDAILHAPAEPFVMVTEYLDSSVKITMRVWCKASDLWDLNFAFLKEVKAAFDQNGINIPYNQVDVHLIKDE
jgi:small conductance mechanosensitive channel